MEQITYSVTTAVKWRFPNAHLQEDFFKTQKTKCSQGSCIQLMLNVSNYLKTNKRDLLISLGAIILEFK